MHENSARDAPNICKNLSFWVRNRLPRRPSGRADGAKKTLPTGGTNRLAHRQHTPQTRRQTVAPAHPANATKRPKNALENPVSKSRDYGTPARISRSSSCDVWLPRRRSPIASRVPNTSRRRNLKKLAWCNLATGIGANERQTHAGGRLRRLITGGDMTSHGGD